MAWLRAGCGVLMLGVLAVGFGRQSWRGGASSVGIVANAPLSVPPYVALSPDELLLPQTRNVPWQ